MAITKILHMKSSKGSFPGKHLKNVIEYITVSEKTCDGRYVTGVNCQPGYAFRKMQETKKKYGKTDKRQGYHIIISFEEQEVDPETAFEIAGKFVERYLGNAFEAVYAVHDNTEHTHAHIVFNSVSCLDGHKFRYEKGDWEKYIQPVTNELCEEYGLSQITIEDGVKRQNDRYKDWNDYRDGKYVWSDMIKRDIDACVLQASTYQSFLDLLSEKGYEIKQNKYLAIKPMGMSRFRRCKSLGTDYLEERIKERILVETLKEYRKESGHRSPKIVRVKGLTVYKKAKLSGLQKRYFAKLYRTGKLKKRPYSQAWKYRDEIRKMHRYHEQYMFLAKNDVHSMGDLLALQQDLEEQRKEASRERSKVYRERKKFLSLFDTLDKMKELSLAEDCFMAGDEFFLEEHRAYQTCFDVIKQEGYTVSELERLQQHYEELTKQAQKQCMDISKELRIAAGIMNEIKQETAVKERENHLEQNQSVSRDSKELEQLQR